MKIVISFASEIKQFQAINNFEAVVKKELVYNFLANSLFDYNEFFSRCQTVNGRI